jgi:hypothetical protein
MLNPKQEKINLKQKPTLKYNQHSHHDMLLVTLKMSISL